MYIYSLVNDVFGSDRVQMEKVMMLLWQFRDDPSVVQFMAQFVAKVRSNARENVSTRGECAQALLNITIHVFSLQEVAMSFEEWNFTFRNWRT
jgi:hypothetical protein